MEKLPHNFFFPPYSIAKTFSAPPPFFVGLKLHLPPPPPRH